MNQVIYRLLLLALFMLSINAKAEPVCEDFLASLSARPAYLELQQCTQHLDRQGKPFVAQYRVTGSEASKAEEYLTRRFGLPPLKRYCCVWESNAHFYRDKPSGRGFELAMGSGETLVNKRESWPDIEFFYITVTVYTEDP